MASEAPPAYDKSGGTRVAGHYGAPVHQPASQQPYGQPQQHQQHHQPQPHQPHHQPYSGGRGGDLPPPAGYGQSVHANDPHGGGVGGGAVHMHGAPAGAVVAAVPLRDINAVCCCSVPSSRFPSTAITSVLLGIGMAICAIVAAARARNHAYCPVLDTTFPDTAAGRAACSEACSYEEEGEECFSFTTAFFFSMYLAVTIVVTTAVAAFVAMGRLRESEAAVVLPPDDQERQLECARSVKAIYVTHGILFALALLVALGFILAAGAVVDSHRGTRDPLTWGFSLSVVFAMELFFSTHILNVRWRLLAGLYGRPALVAQVFGPNPDPRLAAVNHAP